jgi:hypothetical protein
MPPWLVDRACCCLASLSHRVTEAKLFVCHFLIIRLIRGQWNKLLWWCKMWNALAVYSSWVFLTSMDSSSKTFWWYHSFPKQLPAKTILLLDATFTTSSRGFRVGSCQGTPLRLSCTWGQFLWAWVYQSLPLLSLKSDAGTVRNPSVQGLCGWGDVHLFWSWLTTRARTSGIIFGFGKSHVFRWCDWTLCLMSL